MCGWGDLAVWPLFMRALIPFMRTPPSRPHYLSKLPPPNPITVRIRFQHMNFRETETFTPKEISLVFTLSVPEFHSGHHIIFICHVSLGFSHPLQLLQLSLMVMAWQFWGVLLRYMVECGNGGLGEEGHRRKMPLLSRYIMKHKPCEPMANSWLPGWTVFVGCPLCSSSFFLLSILSSLEESHNKQLVLNEWEVRVPLLKVKYLVESFGTLCTGYFFFSSIY